MNPDESQSSFDEAVADPTFWEGYVQWLNEQEKISDFELWHVDKKSPCGSKRFRVRCKNDEQTSK